MMNRNNEILFNILKIVPLLGLILNGGILYAQADSDSLIQLAKEYRYSDPPLAFTYATTGLEEAKDPKNVASAHYQIGILLRNASEYDSAFSHLLISERIRSQLGDMLGVGNVLNAFGTIFSATGQHKLALEKYKEAYRIKLENSASPASINRAWQNLANVFEDLGLQDSSKYYLDNQREYVGNNGSYQERFDYYINYGIWLQTNLHTDSAITYFHKALTEAEKQKDSFQIFTPLFNLAGSYHERGEFTQALGFLRQANSFKNNGILSSEPQKSLSVVFNDISQFDSAYYYLQLQKQLEDSLFTIQQANNLNFLRTVHEVEATNRQKQILAANNRALMISLIFAGAIALSLLFGLYLNQRKRRVEKSLLLEREAKLQNEMISQLHIQESEALQRINIKLEEEYQKVARTLHDQLGNLLVTARLNIQGLIDQLPAQNPNSQQQFQIADQSLENALQAIRQIAHQMHEGRLNQLGLHSVLQELKSTVEASGKIKVELDLIGVEQRLEAQHERLVFQLIRELTTNVIKYAQATELSIQIVREADQIEIMVSDNGQGFPADFNDQQYGLGLRTIHSDLTNLGGSLEIDSQPNHGATIIIDLPL